MLDWDLVKNNKALLTQVEKLVDEAGEIYYDFPDDLREKLNELTGNDWDGETYIEYCGEYWSRSSLEETVYALFHDGEYPDITERKMDILRPLEKIEMTPFEICHVLATNKLGEDFNKKFEALPADEIMDWFHHYFKDWESSDISNEEKTGRFFEFQGDREYGYERSVGISCKTYKTGFLWSKNLTEEDWNAILAYFETQGGYALSEE